MQMPAPPRPTTPAPLKPTGFSAKWKKAKETFFKATGVKKPKSKTFFGLINKPTEGLDRALAKVDAATVAYAAALAAEQKTGQSYARSASALKDLMAAIVNYQKSRASYVQVLAAAGAKAPPVDATNPAVYKNALTMLEKQLKYFDSALKAEYASRKAILDQLLAGKSRADGFIEMAETLMVRIRNVVDKGQAFIAKTRVQPELERDKFVTGISGAARDISVTLNNIEVLLRKNKDFRLPSGMPPEAARRALNAWHTGAVRMVPPTATREDMLRELGEFEGYVEAIDRWAG